MSKVVFLNFPIDYVAEYIPFHRQSFYWGKYYQEEDGRKYLLKENKDNRKVQLPFYIREQIPFFGRR
jgi:hypothetical protein